MALDSFCSESVSFAGTSCSVLVPLLVSCRFDRHHDVSKPYVVVIIHHRSIFACFPLFPPFFFSPFLAAITPVTIRCVAPIFAGFLRIKMFSNAAVRLTKLHEPKTAFLMSLCVGRRPWRHNVLLQFSSHLWYAVLSSGRNPHDGLSSEILESRESRKYRPRETRGFLQIVEGMHPHFPRQHTCWDCCFRLNSVLSASLEYATTIGT